MKNTAMMGGGMEGRRQEKRLEELGKKKTNTVEKSKRLRESPKMKWWVWVGWVCGCVDDATMRVV